MAASVKYKSVSVWTEQFTEADIIEKG